jgi:hypothetical protein
MVPDRNYRFFKVTHNARVEAVGKHVKWVRLPNADLVVSRWRRRVNVFLHLHGSLAAEEQWIRVRLGSGSLYDVHRDDLSELLRRDPLAKIIPASPAPGPWNVICERMPLS